MKKVTVNEQALRKYIEKVIDDAHVTCERENTAKYDFRIIGKYLLFALDCKYRKVRVRIFHRLHKNLPKNFFLNFQLIVPYPLRESDECYDASLFVVCSDILTVRDSIGYWNIFGTPYAIYFRYDSLYHVWPDDISRSAYYDTLHANGYGYDEDQSTNDQPWAKTFEEDWVRYKLAFKEAFGMTPEERGLQVAAIMKTPQPMYHSESD